MVILVHCQEGYGMVTAALVMVVKMVGAGGSSRGANIERWT